MEKFTRRSRRLIALLLMALFLVPTAKVRGQALEHRLSVPDMVNDPNGLTLEPGAGFGQAVASVGDVDGDGIPDFVVGAPNQSADFFAQGQAFIIAGPSATAGRRVLATLNDPEPEMFASFGWAVAGLDDLDGDQVPDVAVGAPGQVVGDSFGKVFVFSGRTGTALFTVNNPSPSGAAMFGNTLASVGDLDGDGVRELAVGAPAQGVNGEGRVFVYTFSGPGHAPALLHTLVDPTPQNFASLGVAVASVGDVNQDGVDDIAVGAPDQDVNGNRDQGRVFLFSGLNGALLAVVDRPVAQADSNFGEALVGLGDVNGDQIDDFAVGAPATTRISGTVFVLSGALSSGGQPAVLATLNDPNPNAAPLAGTSFGSSLAALGDLDGDQVPDLAVGARGRDGSDAGCGGTLGCAAGVGQVHVFSGAAGANGAPTILATLDNPGTPVTGNANYGYQVVVVETVGGGERYLAVSAPAQGVGPTGQAVGQVFLYSLPAAQNTPPPDTEPPTLTVPGYLSVDATSLNGATVTYSVTATDNQDPNPVVTCAPASGSMFPLGATTVSCSASDVAGNSAAAGFTVVVRTSPVPDTTLSAVDGQRVPVSNNGSTLSTGITFTFGSDAVGASYYCSLDNGPSAPCTSPLSRSGLRTGHHVFKVSAGYGSQVDPSPATLTWTILTKAQAAKQLKKGVKDLELSRREHAKLSALLKEIQQHLSNRKHWDDKRACDELDAVLKRLAAKERAGVLTNGDVAPLRQLAQSLRTTIGCHTKYSYKSHRHR